jgi:hypothetical protein
MEIKDKAEIIIQFTQDNFDDEQYDEFFDYNDLGVPLAVAIHNGLVILTSQGIELFNETWEDLCKLFNKDPQENYESIDDIYS